jgi:hydroxyethylthiazole kinase-like uncharacterized protein yjeF
MNLRVASTSAEFHRHVEKFSTVTNGAFAIAVLEQFGHIGMRNANVVLVCSRDAQRTHSTTICRILNERLQANGANVVVIDVHNDTAHVDTDAVERADYIVDVCVRLADTVVDGSDNIVNQIAVIVERRRQSRGAHSDFAAVSISSGGASLLSHSSAESTRSNKRALPFVCSVDAPPCIAERADITLVWSGVVHAALLTFPTAERCGELIAVGDASGDEHGLATLATRASVCALLPPRPRNGHKGTFGTALICAGSNDYWGAPLLSARGALRAGAGIVALAVPPVLRVAIATTLPEATMPSLGDAGLTHDGCLSASAADHLLRDAAQRRVRAVLIGPGTKNAVPFLRAYLANPLAASLPLVLDADGLTALPAVSAEWWQLLPRDTVLTPHPGEMERLCASDPNAATKSSIGLLTCEERMRLAMRCAARWRVVLLLKGAFTVIAAPDGAVCVLPFASPALAIGGSGDVLAGVIVALRCQQPSASAFNAAVAGGFLHGTAGVLLEAERGASGVLAHELAERVPNARQLLLLNNNTN